jgi:hypothetical protein
MFKTGAALVLGALAFGSQAHAATLTQLFQGGNVFISDEDGEKIIDRNNNGTLDVGDSIRGVLTFDQAVLGNNQQISLTHATGNSELTGIFQIQVLSKTASIAFPGQFNYTFGVDSTFASQYGSGAMVVLYEDPVGGTDAKVNVSGITQAQSEASVTDGNLFLVLGLAKGSNGWIARGGDNPALIQNPSDRLGASTFALDRVSSSGVAGNWALNTLSNPAGSGAFIGTSQIGGGFPGSPWPLSSESDAQFSSIPTPSAVLGGLLLMGGLIRRKAHA